MTPRLLLMVLAALAPAGAQCLPVSGARILAGDMARAVPAFAGMPPELVLGYAPAPGACRYYGAAELSRLARRYGLAMEPGMEACFARPLETLTRERVAAALRAAMPAARIEVIESAASPSRTGNFAFRSPGCERIPPRPLRNCGTVRCAAPGKPIFRSGPRCASRFQERGLPPPRRLRRAIPSRVPNLDRSPMRDRRVCQTCPKSWTACHGGRFRRAR